MADYKVIDADGHVRESIAGMREFLEPRWQRRNLFPNDAWDRDLRGKLGAKPEGPEDQLAAMDKDGIDVTTWRVSINWRLWDELGEKKGFGRIKKTEE